MVLFFMNDDKYFMSLALNEAKQALIEDEVPIGCVLVMGDEVVASSHNTRERDLLTIGHAEINAIRIANQKLSSWRLDECTLYVTLEPCSMCAGAIQQSRIKRVVYGAIDKKGGAMGGLYDLFLTPKLNHYPLVSFLENNECSEILKEYFLKKRKK